MAVAGKIYMYTEGEARSFSLEECRSSLAGSTGAWLSIFGFMSTKSTEHWLIAFIDDT